MLMLKQNLIESEQNSAEQGLNIPPPPGLSVSQPSLPFPLISQCHGEEKMKGFHVLLEFRRGRR